MCFLRYTAKLMLMRAAGAPEAAALSATGKGSVSEIGAIAVGIGAFEIRVFSEASAAETILVEQVQS